MVRSFMPSSGNHRRITLAQLNVTVGDIDGNVAKIRDAWEQARQAGSQLLVCSELAIIGYAPEDIVNRKQFRAHAMQAVRELAKITKDGPAILTGGLWVARPESGELYNAALLLEDGTVKDMAFKAGLPHFGVFDEMRNFTAGKGVHVLHWQGVRLGALVCRDVWEPHLVEQLAAQQPDIVVVLNASPYDAPKRVERLMVQKNAVAQCAAPLIYLNQVGGQDELVFDGHSVVMNADSTYAVQLPAWEEAIAHSDWKHKDRQWVCIAQEEYVPGARQPSLEEVEYRALMLGVRDYVRKNGFASVILGLSGGVDSALVAALAADALGAEAVHAVRLPSKYSSGHSLEDAALCANRLGIALRTLPIADMVSEAEESLKVIHGATLPDLAEQNLQSRIRGTLLMALSNAEGHLLLSTGNKSELAVGYATLYGDMNGGFNPIKDVYKTRLYELARWRNQHHFSWMNAPKGEMIPDAILTKVPSAELKPDQTDQDSLPDYPVLDWILQQLVEGELCVEDILQQANAEKRTDIVRETVAQVAKMLYRAEYKRRQAAPGTKISRMHFGKDRRYPLTNRYWSDS